MQLQFLASLEDEQNDKGWKDCSANFEDDGVTVGTMEGNETRI
jgi:hypothetical protein